MKRIVAVLSVVAVFTVAIGVSVVSVEIGVTLPTKAGQEILTVSKEPEYTPKPEEIETPEETEEAVETEETVLDDDSVYIEEMDYETSYPEVTQWDGSVLNSFDGVVEQGPSGRETFYNLPMQGVVNQMRELGYSEEEYPYWERDDGAKMLGCYIIVAANAEHPELGSYRPYGTVLESSLGTALVCDTGDFVYDNPSQIDVAVTWVV